MRSHFKDATEQVGRTLMEVDFFGPALLTQALLPGMGMGVPHFVVRLHLLAGAVTAVYPATRHAIQRRWSYREHILHSWENSSSQQELLLCL